MPSLTCSGSGGVFERLALTVPPPSRSTSTDVYGHGDAGHAAVHDREGAHLARGRRASCAAELGAAALGVGVAAVEVERAGVDRLPATRCGGPSSMRQIVDDRNLLAHCGPPRGLRGPQVSPGRGRRAPKVRRWAHASVAELADAPGLGPGLERGGSSSLPARTTISEFPAANFSARTKSPARGIPACRGFLGRSSRAGGIPRGGRFLGRRDSRNEPAKAFRGNAGATRRRLSGDTAVTRRRRLG